MPINVVHGPAVVLDEGHLLEVLQSGQVGGDVGHEAGLGACRSGTFGCSVALSSLLHPVIARAAKAMKTKNIFFFIMWYYYFVIPIY